MTRFSIRRALVLAALASASSAPAWAQPDKPLRIGFSMARTGMLAVATPSQLNTYELWREQVNARGGMDVGGVLDPVQQGFIQEHGLQCGFCTPGMMLTARALLDCSPDPDEAEIREAISGNICRCTGYENIVRAIRWAAAHPASQAAGQGAGG